MGGEGGGVFEFLLKVDIIIHIVGILPSPTTHRNDSIRQAAALLGAVVAFCVYLKGMREYSRQNTQARAQCFISMRERLKNNRVFEDLCTLLDKDASDLKEFLERFPDLKEFLECFPDLKEVLKHHHNPKEVLKDYLDQEEVLNHCPHIEEILKGYPDKEPNSELKEVPFEHKRSLLGVFEEVALMMNSGLIKKEVAYYMFGYYAIRCWQSDNFWGNVNRHSIYWRLFRNFAEEMLQIEKAIAEEKLKYDPKNYKL